MKVNSNLAIKKGFPMRQFFWLLELAAIAAVIALVYSQLILPMVRKTPFFPLFRSRPRVEREIEATNEALEDADLGDELKQRQRQLEKRQRQPGQPK